MLGLAGSAHAVEVAGELLEFYGNFYPQYQVTNFGDSANAKQSTMTKGLNTPAANPAVSISPRTDVAWSQSYIGFKGKKTLGDFTVGYDLQGLVWQTNSVNNYFKILGEGRDTFAFVSHANFGTLQLGKMDTIYKELGDRVRMLGVSSSNFVSTSGILSSVGWKSAVKAAPGAISSTNGTAVANTTSFNTRINDQLRYISPNWGGFEFGVSLRPDPRRSSTTDGSLSAIGARWSNKTYYVGLAQEVHNDYRTVSGTGTTGGSVGTNIFSASPRSKDTATRLSLGYTAEPFRLAADFANLKYTEDATAIGKFSSYRANTWQVSGEYAVNAQVKVGANYAKGSQGSCILLGGGPCSTDGLGGNQFSLGARYDFNKYVGLFALYGRTISGAAATYGSGSLASAIGGKTSTMAVGVHAKF